MKALTVTALAALALPLAAASADRYPINPGHWEVKESWLGLINKTEHVCVEPANITQFLAAPCNHIYHCNYPVQRIGAGKIYFEGTIFKHDELYHVKGGGTYSPTSLDMSFSGHGHWHIVPVPNASASLHGTYLGPDCPASARRFKPRKPNAAP